MSTLANELRQAADAFAVEYAINQATQIIDRCREAASGGRYSFKQTVSMTDAEAIKKHIESKGVEVELIEYDTAIGCQTMIVVSWE